MSYNGNYMESPYNGNSMIPLSKTREEQYLSGRTFSNLDRRLMNWSMEVEAPKLSSYGSNTDRWGLPRGMPAGIELKCNMFNKRNRATGRTERPYNFHHDASGPDEYCIPYTNHEHILKERFDKVTLPNIFAWDPMRGVGSSLHLHLSVVGPFKSSRGYPCAPMAHIAVTWTSLVNVLALGFPFFIWDQGRRRIDYWAYPVIDGITPAQVRRAYTANEYYFTDCLTGERRQKNPTNHGSPYMALQWNQKSYKATTMELRINEQHPYISLGVMSCLSSLLKSRVALLRSLQLENSNGRGNLLQDMWLRWRSLSTRSNGRMGGGDPVVGQKSAAWKTLDIAKPIKLKESSPKLCYSKTKKYRKREWSSPLEFFKELCLFMKYEKLYNRRRGTYNKVDAGLIMLLMANGLEAYKVPSYLMWDIKRLYHYTFFEGKGKQWSYKRGLLTEEEVESHCPLLTEDPRDENTNTIIKTRDDPHWGNF